MEPILRLARLEDAPALAVVAVETWRAAYTGLMPDELIAKMNLERRERRFTEVLEAADPVKRMWVAERDGAVVGWASSGPCRDEDAADTTGELYGLYVLQDHWGSGAGRRLMQRVIDDFAQREMAPVLLWVLTANKRARHFYERAGFVVDVEELDKDFLGFDLTHTRYRRD